MGKALGGINQASRSDAVTAVMVGLGATLGAMAINVLTPIAAEAQTPPTVTPIKHLIVVIGENRSFDNVFGTYVPPPGQSVWNLLSQGIVNKTGARVECSKGVATTGRRDWQKHIPAGSTDNRRVSHFAAAEHHAQCAPGLALLTVNDSRGVREKPCKLFVLQR
jgi:hypothetical protein